MIPLFLTCKYLIPYTYIYKKVVLIKKYLFKIKQMPNHDVSFTNEEKRVVIYSGSDKSTVPSKVTPDTPLEELNLNWREKDLPERERTKHVHRLHPYLGKFIPQLVEIFLRKYFHPGQTVCDPFSGSGTTLVQANELGINSVGSDISAFNVILTRAKITHYNLNIVNREILDILAKTAQATQPDANSDQPSLFLLEERKPKYATSNEEYLKQWFAPQALQELLVYRDQIHNYEYQDILRVILSRSARSARLTTHFDLDFPKAPQTEPYWCYKHSRTCIPTTQAYPFLRRYSFDTIQRIEEFSALRTDATALVHHEDSRVAYIPPVDGVITSPPYVGLINYHEQHRYAYSLLGIEDKSEEEIGPAYRGTNQKAQDEYQIAIADVFRRVSHVMPAGGYLIVVASDKYGLYDKISQLCGVEVEAIINRHVNRRTGRRSNEFYESVFIWRKP